MSWESTALLAKAKVFFARAFDASEEDDVFGLWCTMGLELLARAAVASVSPVLLADPDSEQRNILHALNRGSEKHSRKSIETSRVLVLCKTLFSAKLSDDDIKVVAALVNRRNEELHTGAAAFAEYNRQQWLIGFHRTCRALAEVIGETLESVLGQEFGSSGVSLLEESKEEVRSQVQGAIAAHKRVWDARSDAERAEARKSAEAAVKALAFQRHHEVVCPGCASSAAVQGDTYGPEHVVNHEDRIVVRQSVIPRSFACTACGLKLNSYAALTEARLGAHYTRTTTYDPVEYFGIETLDTMSTSEILSRLDLSDIMDHVQSEYQEYDNE